MRRNFYRPPPGQGRTTPKVLIKAVTHHRQGSVSFAIQDNEGDGPDPEGWLAAIIDGSDDAIISKDLHGMIRSWNLGATRLFGYTAEEILGKPVTLLIPEDRLEEEPAILAMIRDGKRVEHFETRRRCKNGALVDISLTISPIHGRNGHVVGASKIARDITDRRKADSQQQLLIGEMHHRVKNLFALASAIVSLSARSGVRAEDVPQLILARLNSLARAHELTMTNWQDEGNRTRDTDFMTLVRTILEPYAAHGDRIVITGENPAVGGKSLTNLALFLHELATNSAKYGALRVVEGHLTLHVTGTADMVDVLWSETGGPAGAVCVSPGFGSRLERGLVEALGATIDRDWRKTGLVVRLSLPRGRLVV